MEAAVLGAISLSSTSRRENHGEHVLRCLLPLPAFKSFPVTSRMLLLLWRSVKYWYGCCKKNAFGEAVRLHLGTEDANTASPHLLPFRLSSSAKAVCKAYLPFEIPDVSNSRRAVGQGVSVCVDFKLSYFN